MFNFFLHILQGKLAPQFILTLFFYNLNKFQVFNCHSWRTTAILMCYHIFQILPSPYLKGLDIPIRKSNIEHLLHETESNIQLIASRQGNVGRSEAEILFLLDFLFCAINWMLDEVKSNKCFIITKKLV